MDFDQVPRGALIAGIAGALLFIVMWLSWFGAPDTEVVTPAGDIDIGSFAEAAGVDTTLNAWQAFDFIDIILLLTVIASVGLLVMSAMGTSVNLPVAASAIVTGLGALATLLVLYRIIDTPYDFDREFGVFLGLLLCAGVTIGGWLAMQEEGTSFGDLGGGYDDTGGYGGTGTGTGTGGYTDPGAQPPPPGQAPPPGGPPPPPPPAR